MHTTDLGIRRFVLTIIYVGANGRFKKVVFFSSQCV